MERTNNSNCSEETPERELFQCPACKGEGKIDYLRIGMNFECAWCLGTGKVDRRTRDRFVNLMTFLYRDQALLWL